MQCNQPLNPIKIDTTAAMRIAKGSATPYEKTLMTRNDIWHKILIYRGGTMDKELVLKSILQAVQPIDLIPVRYTVCGEDSYFLIRNCDNALQQLCRLNLIIKTVSGELLLLTITLGFASIHDLKMNIRPLLLALLTKRYLHSKRALNLNSFHRDPDIINTVYCPLSLPRTLSSVLNIAIKDLANFDKLCLSFNELNSLSGMDGLKFNVTCLDLRNNCLLNADCLQVVKDMNVQELWLDGNPLCENYSSSKRYIESIRRYCPNLRRLDGVYIGAPQFPISYDNFVPSQCRELLISQFIKHFFSLYDAKDRSILQGIYHHKAFYSITLDTTFAGRVNKNWPNRGSNYISTVVDNPVPEGDKLVPQSLARENRNLILDKSNFLDSLNVLENPRKREERLLYHGSEAILRALKRAPETQHFQQTFTYSLLYDSGTSVCFTIDGVFKDKNNEKFLFNRTFVLLAMEEEEFRILNDQNLVYCTALRELSLEEDKVTMVYPSIQLRCLSSNEKLKIIKQFRKVTKMREKYCRKFVEEAGWNLRRALVQFNSQYKSKAIVIEAFN